MELTNNYINYIEFKANDLPKIKTFYNTAFNWKFTDYGPNYIAFEHSGIAGGFEFSKDKVTHGALVILYHNNLEAIQNKIIQAGGTINIPIFSFPGGRRFHFIDPSGNQLAVWSE